MREKEGIPPVQEEACEVKRRRAKRTGASVPKTMDKVQLGISVDKGQVWETDVDIAGKRWHPLYFGAALQWLGAPSDIVDDLQGPISERDQCLLIPLAAGIARPSGDISKDARAVIKNLASSSQTQMRASANECPDAVWGFLGWATPPTCGTKATCTYDWETAQKTIAPLSFCIVRKWKITI